MANISDVSGEFTIQAKNSKTIKDLIHLMQYLDLNCDYMTCFTDYHLNDNQFDNKIIKINEGEYEFNSTFAGSGRWVYLNNIESMARWILDVINLDNDQNDREIIRNLSEQDYSIVFDYVDYEPGCEVFERMVVELIHKKGNPFEENSINVRECEDLEKTIVNYSELMGRQFDEAMEELYLWGNNFDELGKERQEEIMKELKPQIGDIEKYFKESFSNLMMSI